MFMDSVSGAIGLGRALARKGVPDRTGGYGASNAPAERRRLLLAGRAYRAGETVFALEHVRWWEATAGHTVAHPSGRRFHDPLLDNVVHADDPNCVLSFDPMALVARRDIAPGEAISRDFDAARGLVPR